MKIALIRHGMTDGNYKKRYIGITDEHLRDTKSLNLTYPECDTVIVSPMKRCIETAEFIYSGRDTKVCEGLRECNFGDFENRSYEELKDNADYIKWIESGGTVPFPNGESHKDFIKRCMDSFYEMTLEKCESMAFVVHGGSIMAVMHSLFGGEFYDYQIRNGGMFCFEYDAKSGQALGGFIRRDDE